jgi:hypothetical protein
MHPRIPRVTRFSISMSLAGLLGTVAPDADDSSSVLSSLSFSSI